MFKQITIFILLCISFQAVSLTTKQQKYLEAIEALNSDDKTNFQVLRKQLNDYPLAIYLDYYEDIKIIKDLTGVAALKKIEQYKDSPLYNNIKHKYLETSAEMSNFTNFLLVSSTPPKNLKLQCFFYQAKLAKQQQITTNDISTIWLTGNPLPKECNGFVNSLKINKLISHDLIWDRAILAATNKQSKLLKDLISQLPKSKDNTLLLSIAQKPSTVKKHNYKSHKQQEILSVGIKLVAKSNLNEAINIFNDKKTQLTDKYQQQLLSYLVYRALLSNNPAYKKFIDLYLTQIATDNLVERRLRLAIFEKNGKDLLRNLALLSPEGQEKDVWQYWKATYLPKQRKTILNTLSQKRSFYGFVAADILKNEVNINDLTISPNAETLSSIKNDPAIARIIELRAIGAGKSALTEWTYALKDKTPDTIRQYSYYALNNNWPDLAVSATIKGKLWNDLQLRFPKAYFDEFKKQTTDSIKIEELLAISRRESAFYPYATSPVGARGLMQLMPTTASHIAPKAEISYKNKNELYNITTNIALGSYYYQNLVNSFNGNRIMAIASYNAGSSRIYKWLNKSNGLLNYVEFIETIPFTETREYVQAVTSYRVLFQILYKGKYDFISTDEATYKY